MEAQRGVTQGRIAIGGVHQRVVVASIGIGAASVFIAITDAITVGILEDHLPGNTGLTGFVHILAGGITLGG